ncbi:MAG: RNA 2',3'-cyclic phosphodiesterase [Methanomicrobiaceae archaeon]|uniref:2'-5' rna ligase n=1 Tax=hydrocarbon metagenome TaxID=938273 RepID=A0A0W8FF26_9ZZZZ|nr:RNA 2',3'-cyclic phosphodiesterase [Methanomicrobiaceae archaeon]MDD5419393.1 RNA 2',3'-cyclic phosphodiesterase [Methanomicrobiaceae archaeon]
MVRTFIAIDLPDSVKQKIRESQNILTECDARLSVVDPGNVHITLKFLGEIEPRMVERVAEALRAVRAGPFTVTIGPATADRPKRPRVVWCGVSDAGECASLHRQIEDLLAPLGFEREGRKFTPHATVARVKRYDPSLMRQIASLAREDIGACEVKGITLKKSTLTPRGPIYEDLAEVEW